MTREEALKIVEMVSSAWAGNTWHLEQMDSFARAIEELDAEFTTKAVLRAQKELRFRPAVAELREYVRIERQVAQRQDWRNQPAEKEPMPEWVKQWKRARAVGDFRPFPEQALAFREQGHAVPDTPYFDRDAWVQEDEHLQGPLPRIMGIL